MSGHSRWANIKHKKAKLDASRGKRWSKCARAIIVAAKRGGADPDINLGLRYAIDEAKFENMPKDTIEKAIQKGAGGGAGESYEATVYEGYGPGGVAFMLDILTDNRNRTAGEIRRIFEKQGGNLGASGCVAYMFAPRGEIFIAKSSADEDKVMTVALDAGAEDVVDAGESWQVLCAPGSLFSVKQAIEAAGTKVESWSMAMIPATFVTVTGKNAERVIALAESLEEQDDVQKVHANFDIPEEELAALEK